MGNFLELSFWLDVYSLPLEGRFFWLTITVAFLAVLFGLAGVFLRKRLAADRIKREIWLRFSRIGLTFGLISLVWIFFRQERAPYLGMRLWPGLLILTCLVWIFFILKFVFIKAPKAREEKKRLEELRKYLP
ncbi:MAG: hypothetical protein A2927_01460 [Candidatus Komeilibacteria bacterium RIFCSPLOWO2_01_FULL_45_10]|uniref:DUF5671 domain-containing protein n=1 Tax=Candidatus Komeilibacteria bacterium RIFCSPLOWO2_01_FULL_45_10 TaxID=1798550 RepID=A0A1G2BL98_9BACT|nr:MAG: hypothetical protein A2927_01460 [Candidatus Komeilibacteria bacterium RIFCSPLOWO2_01_FULL_45_10]